MYSTELWDKIKVSNSSIDEELKAWKNRSDEYADASNERAKITEIVWERVSSARDKTYRRNQLRAEFVRYLEIAEGNKKIALAFLEKAKSLSDFPELREEFCPPEKAEEA